jgi:hypothetical protein
MRFSDARQVLVKSPLDWADDARVNLKRVGCFLLGVALAVWFKGGFVSMPRMTRAGTSIQVGEAADATHANYALAENANFEATSVGYEFGGGGSVVCDLGSRAILSWIDSDSYRSMSAGSCKTGQCMASYLNDAEGRGRIGHLLLIPGDKSVLSQMRSTRLPMGKRFHLAGNYLDFDSGTVQGHSFDGRIGNVRYFLVTSIEAR